MKRTLCILVGGLLLAASAYCGFFFFGTTADRDISHGPSPELAWLKHEFHLSDTEFERISQLHAAYQPRCKEMCQRIAKNENALRALLAKNTNVTPEIQITLAEAARIRAECQAAMLAHFYEVSRTMPPAEGTRYLAWVEARTLAVMSPADETNLMSGHDRGQH